MRILLRDSGARACLDWYFEKALHGQIWTAILWRAGDDMNARTDRHEWANRFFALAHHADSESDVRFVLPRLRREHIAREAILAAARGTRIDEGDIAHILARTAHERGLGVTDIMV